MTDFPRPAREEARKRAENSISGPLYAHSAQKGAGEDQWLTSLNEDDIDWDATPDDFEPEEFIVAEKLEMDYYAGPMSGGGRWRKGNREQRRAEIIQDRNNFKFFAHARTDLLRAFDHIDAQNERIRELERENVRLGRALLGAQNERDTWRRLCNTAERALVNQPKPEEEK